VGNGQYNVNGTHTYNAPGTYQVVAQVNGNGIQGSVQGVVTVAYSPNQRFINRLFEDDLHRSAYADPNGLAYWVNQLESLERQGDSPATAQSIVASNVARLTEALNGVVNQFYETLLHRGADSSGLNYWVGRLQSGATEEQVLAGLLSSGEFQNDANAWYPSGNWNWSYVLGLYEVVLKRAPSNSEASYWYNALPSQGYYQVAYDIVTSAEFRTDAVQTFYGTQAQAFQPFFPDLLDRYMLNGGASSSEIAYWVNSRMDFLSMEIAMASTQEFYIDTPNV
jgi:hypothetical protein